MDYPEMKTNQHGIPFRLLETIGDREYWQVTDKVVSSEIGARRLGEGTPEECWPAETRLEGTFENWEVTRTYVMRLVDIHPDKVKRRYITCKNDWSGAKKGSDLFSTVGSMMGDSRIEDLFVRVEEYHDDRESCYIWSGCGTELLVEVAYLSKLRIRNLSEENIRRLVDGKSQRSIPAVAQQVVDFFEGRGSRPASHVAIQWLAAVGYDTTGIEKVRADFLAREKARREREQEVKRQEREQAEQAAKAKEESERAESLRTIREGILSEQEVLVGSLPHGCEVLISLFDSEGLNLPLRTKGWVYKKLYSIRGAHYRFYKSSPRRSGQGSDTFGRLLVELREKILPDTAPSREPSRQAWPEISQEPLGRPHPTKPNSLYP